MQGNAQSYFLYGTHTLAESSTNPSVQVFENKKECKKFAFNVFIPQLDLDLSSYGPISKVFYVNYVLDKLDSGNFNLNPSKNNYITLNENTHFITAKILNHRKDGSEFILDYSVRSLGYLHLKDQILSLLPTLNNFFSTGNIPQTTSDYPGIVNTHSFLYGFSQISLGFRQNLNDELSWGIQGGYLSGISGANFQINSSDLLLSPEKLSLNYKGSFKINRPFTSDSSFSGFNSINSYFPSTRNPGFMISLGFNYKIDPISDFTGNLKDLGFIHWNGAKQYLSTDTLNYTNSDPFNFKSQFKKGFTSYYHDGGHASYNGVLPAYIEGIYNRSFSKYWRLSFIVNKNIITPEANIHMVNDIRYNNFHCLINTGFNTLNNFKMGFHFLYRSRGFEAFIGSENIGPGLNLSQQWMGTNTPGNSSALNLNFGMALRFGHCFYIQTATDTRVKGDYNFWQRLFQKKHIPYEREKI